MSARCGGQGEVRENDANFKFTFAVTEGCGVDRYAQPRTAGSGDGCLVAKTQRHTERERENNQKIAAKRFGYIAENDYLCIMY